MQSYTIKNYDIAKVFKCNAACQGKGVLFFAAVRRTATRVHFTRIRFLRHDSFLYFINKSNVWINEDHCSDPFKYVPPSIWRILSIPCVVRKDTVCLFYVFNVKNDTNNVIDNNPYNVDSNQIFVIFHNTNQRAGKCQQSDDIQYNGMF